MIITEFGIKENEKKTKEKENQENKEKENQEGKRKPEKGCVKEFTGK